MKPNTPEGPPSRTDWVINRMRDAILSGELKPGEPLVPSRLSDLWGVSHTPLREAIQTLGSEGLIVTNAHRSAQVAGLSIRELREIYDLGMVLVSLAVKRSMELADDQWSARVTAAYEDLRREASSKQVDPVEHEAAHRRFHRAIRSCCDSEWLLRLIEQLTNHGSRYRAQAWQRLSTRSIPAYDELYEACMAGDAEKAVAATVSELDDVRRLIEACLLEDDLATDDGGEPTVLTRTVLSSLPADLS